MRREWNIILMLAAVVSAVPAGEVQAAKRAPGVVPPGWEIEVLDPNADPLGRPAVELHRDPYGNLQVDIPPTLLVHRYYYSGDRSFQAQILPGGPCIVVANHPKTGERCYIPVNMVPGAPRVTYTGHGIEYDYREHAIKIKFGACGQPTVKYSGKRWHNKLVSATKAQEMKQRSKELFYRCTASTAGAGVFVGDTLEMIGTPVVQLMRSLPGGRALLDSDIKLRLAEKAEEHKRESANAKAQNDEKWRSATYRTVR